MRTGVGNTYAWETRDIGLVDRWGVLYPQFADGHRRLIVKGLVDGERPGELAWARERTCTANQNSCRVIFVARHDVEHPVHTITQVNVPTAASVKHRGVALCPAFVRVGRFVFKSVVSLDFSNR